MRRRAEEPGYSPFWRGEHSDKPGPKHLVIGDLQVKPGVPLAHLKWIARYAAHKRPDAIIQIGDWGDFPSLSSYDKGKRSSEGKRYKSDVDSVNESINLFEEELRKEAGRSYKPRKHVTLGNHDGGRVERAVEDQATWEGTISTDDMKFKEHGWLVHEFLKPVEIDGITYAHFYPVGPGGRITQTRNGCPSARSQVQRMMRSCTAGHMQGFDFGTHHTPYGTYYGLILGSTYLHDEKYLSPMGANHWRGVAMANDIQRGTYQLLMADLHFLKRRYGD